MIEIIAEIGWNHMGDMELAKHMIQQAAENGATYAKFQTWSVDRLKPGSWDTDGRREIYEKAELSKENHIELMDACHEHKIQFMSSVFSIQDAGMLISVGHRKAVKIPSFESRNHELINFCMNNFDRVYISFGTCTFGEIVETANLFREKPHKFYPMHCVSSYPLNPEDANLRRMGAINLSTGTINKAGYSDHMEGVESAKIAIGEGATVIEKHFTTDRSLPGRDNKFAILPEQLKDLSDYIRLRERMMLSLEIDYQACEQDSRDNYSGRFNG